MIVRTTPDYTSPEAHQRERRLVSERLNKLAPLDSAAFHRLGQLAGLHTHRAGTQLVGERQPQLKPRFLVSGWAARVRSLPDGRRQILGFLLPGDALGVCHRPHPLALGTVVAVTSVDTLDARALDVGALEQDAPTLAEALHISASLHEGYLLNQIMRLGRLTAYERMCHLFLELRDRLKLVSLATDDRLPMPLTQEMLADVNGLSTVHVNRVLQQLRRESMLELRGGQVIFLDPGGMTSAANYYPPEPSRWL
jgi:CRP-like cAMP-binding protein